MVEDLCSIGMSLNKECNLLVFIKLVSRYQIEDQPEEDRTLLKGCVRYIFASLFFKS